MTEYDTIDELIASGGWHHATTTHAGVTIEANPRHEWRDRVDASTWSVRTAPALIAYRAHRFYGIREYIVEDEADMRAMIDELLAEVHAARPHLAAVADATVTLADRDAIAREARDARDEAMRAARDAGEKPADIADAAGVSMALYYRIVAAKKDPLP